MSYIFFCLFSPVWQSAAQVVTVHTFSESVGPAVSLPASIIGTFRLFFTTAVLTAIVRETNQYAQQVLGDNIGSWANVNEEEILAVLGFSLLMGINQLPNLRDYWKRDKIIFPLLTYSRPDNKRQIFEHNEVLTIC